MRLPAKNGQVMMLQRPLQLLYPLEIKHFTKPLNQDSSAELDIQAEVEDGQPQKYPEGTHPRRPLRQSALRAQDCFKEWSLLLMD